MTYESLGRTMRFAAVALAAAVGFATSARAAMTFKGVLDDEGTITFYYDEANHSAEGTVYTRASGATGYPGWRNNADITKAVFTPSCAAFEWTVGLQWMFSGCSNLTTVVGIGNLDTSSATSFYQMFYNCSSLVSVDTAQLKSPCVTNFGDMFRECSSLKTLDLSSLTSAIATGCGNMFRGCSQLTTVYVRSGFDLKSASGDWMFTSCPKIVGGNGTTISSTVDSSYAHVDVAGNPGYFTLKNQTLTIDTSDFAAKHIASVAVTVGGAPVDPDEVGGNVWTFPKGTALTILYTAESGYEFSGESTVRDAAFATDGLLDDEIREGSEIPTAELFVRYALTIVKDDFTANHVATVVVTLASTGEAVAPQQDGTYVFVPGVGFTISYRAEADYFFGHYVSTTNDVTYAASGLAADATVSGVPAASLHLTGTRLKGVVTDSDPTTLTLRYDAEAYSGTVYGRRAASAVPAWAGLSTVQRVVVDDSLCRFEPAGDGFQYFFYGLSAVTNIEGLSNLKTSQARNLTQMFCGCASLTALDLSRVKMPEAMHFGDMFFGCSSLVTLDISGFSSANVTGCGNMFRDCSRLVTIYAKSGFDLKSATGDWMFIGASKVVGGNGTKVTVGLRDYTSYAHVDVPGNPGYFTLKPRRGALLLFR